MKTNSQTITKNSVEERALVLLSAGLSQVKVAEALGVDSSRISQLCADADFSTQLSDARYEALSKHNEQDSKLDSLEAKIVSRIEDTVDQVYKPMELVRMLQVVNMAKRRGTENLAPVQEISTVLNLLMPTKIVNKFITNINNQVVKAGDTELITIQSGSLSTKLKEIEDKRVRDHELRNRVGELLDSCSN